MRTSISAARSAKPIARSLANIFLRCRSWSSARSSKTVPRSRLKPPRLFLNEKAEEPRASGWRRHGAARLVATAYIGSRWDCQLHRSYSDPFLYASRFVFRCSLSRPHFVLHMVHRASLWDRGCVWQRNRALELRSAARHPRASLLGHGDEPGHVHLHGVHPGGGACAVRTRTRSFAHGCAHRITEPPRLRREIGTRARKARAFSAADHAGLSGCGRFQEGE